MLRKETVIKRVKGYLNRLPIRIEDAIIFGSTARDERLYNSDIDLIVISEDFKGMDFHERMVLLFRVWDHKTVTLEAFGFTKDEFQEKVRKSLWFKEIDKYGIKVSAGNISKREPRRKMW